MSKYGINRPHPTDQKMSCWRPTISGLWGALFVGPVFGRTCLNPPLVVHRFPHFFVIKSSLSTVWLRVGMYAFGLCSLSRYCHFAFCFVVFRYTVYRDEFCIHFDISLRLVAGHFLSHMDPSDRAVLLIHLLYSFWNLREQKLLLLLL